MHEGAPTIPRAHLKIVDASKIPFRLSVSIKVSLSCSRATDKLILSKLAATSSPRLCVHLKCTNCTTARRGEVAALASYPHTPALSSIPLCSEHSSWDALGDISISHSAGAVNWSTRIFTCCRRWMRFHRRN